MDDANNTPAFRFVTKERAADGVTYPTWTIDSAPYWMACAEGRLTYQVCEECSSTVFHPRAVCSNCLSERLSWRESNGRGKIYSYSVQHVPIDRSRPHKPRALGIVHLDEDWYMFSEIVSDDPYSLRIGQEVRVRFDRIADDLVLPKFDPVQVDDKGGSAQ